jgi:hypothetical protein
MKNILGRIQKGKIKLKNGFLPVKTPVVDNEINIFSLTVLINIYGAHFLLSIKSLQYLQKCMGYSDSIEHE